MLRLKSTETIRGPSKNGFSLGKPKKSGKGLCGRSYREVEGEKKSSAALPFLAEKGFFSEKEREGISGKKKGGESAGGRKGGFRKKNYQSRRTALVKKGGGRGSPLGSRCPFKETDEVFK